MRPFLVLTVASVVAGRPQITAESLGFDPKAYGSHSDYLGGPQITAASLGFDPSFYGSASDYFGSDGWTSGVVNKDLITQSKNLIETLAPALEALGRNGNSNTGKSYSSTGLKKTQNLLDNLNFEALASIGGTETRKSYASNDPWKALGSNGNSNEGNSYSSTGLKKTQNILDNIDLEALANLRLTEKNVETEVTNIEPNVIQETRDILSSIIPTLKELASDPSSADVANKIIQENFSSCVSSLQEGIDSIESTMQLINSLEPEIVSLTDKVNSFAELSDPVEIMRETGDLLRLLKPLADMTRQKDFSLSSCGASEPDFSFPSLGRSGGGAFTTFFRQLKSTLARMENMCTNDIFNRDSITAIGDMLDVLADLYVNLGDEENGEKIRYGKTYTERVTV